jgi:hypothetical protein
MKTKMNKIEELIKQAGTDSSGKWISVEQAHRLANLIIDECYIAIENTNTSHVYTTFDQGQFKATIRKSKDAVKQHFGL